MGKKERILGALIEKDLTSKEIAKLKIENFSNDCSEIQRYLYRLHKQELVRPIEKKGRYYVYRSIIKDTFLVLEDIAEIKKIPKKLKIRIYEIIVKLLPTYLEKQLDKLLKSKTKIYSENISKFDEEIKNLMYS